MKIVHIGAADGLAATLAERMVQEGNEVYLISDKPLSKEYKGLGRHRFFRIPRDSESYTKLIRSLSPDCVVFSGMNYTGDISSDQAEADVTLLARTLGVASVIPDSKFVLLSSTEVYGNTDGSASEATECVPNGERAMRFLREEQLVDLYRKQGLDTVTLRASQLYTNEPKEGELDFLSRGFTAARKKEGTLPAPMYQPLHAADLADAIKRVIDAGTDSVYNVTGGSHVTAQELIQMIFAHEGIQEHPVQWDNSSCVTLADSAKIRKELGWRDFRDLAEQMEQGASSAQAIHFSESRKDRRAKSARRFPVPVRQTIENVLLFLLFCTLSYVCREHPLFSQMNWLLMYVVVVAVSYNIPQAALASALSSAAYLIANHLGVQDLMQFTSIASSLLVIVEYFFFGIIISYTISILREEVRNIREDLEILRTDYQDLREINDENVLIKNEYEERLLTSKTGFPKLYSLISRLMVTEPDRILMETMRVISEMVGTSTVAVYQAQAGSPWLRLVGALNETSAMEGKSWNLSKVPHILNAVQSGEVYQGKFGSDEPAIVMPIMYHGTPEAVVLIRALPFESETLYHLNLLKTLSLLLGDTMEKALQYEELAKASYCIEGTDILKPESFRDRVKLAREKADMNWAEYCVVELKHAGTLKEAGAIVSQKLRATDCLGTNEEGRLFALLNNTGPDNIEHLRTRLKEVGVDAVPVTDASIWD